MHEQSLPFLAAENPAGTKRQPAADNEAITAIRNPAALIYLKLVSTHR
jgi:hypothetical protein